MSGPPCLASSDAQPYSWLVNSDELFPASADPEDDDDGREDEPESPWFGPPSDELGICVPFGAVAGRSDRAVVAITHALVYSTGVVFPIAARARGLRQSQMS